jgi:fatty-acid desaturase
VDIKSIVDGNLLIATEKCSIIAILTLTIISILIVRKFFNSRSSDGVQEYTIETVLEEKAITSEFLLSYVLPLFAFDFTVWHKVVLFLLFYSVLAFLCVRHSYFSVNVVLEMMKYRFYKCDLQNEDEVKVSKVVISKEHLNNRKNEMIKLRLINNEYSADVTDWKS